MNPFEQPELYDKLIYGGQPTPGVVTLSGFKRSVAWDVKQGGGQDGASTTRKGKEPASGTVTVYLVDEPGQDSEQDLWQGYCQLLQFAQQKAIAYDCYHPDLMTLRITSAIVTWIGQVEHDGKGGAKASFGLMEYLPPKKKKATKPSSKASGKKPGDPPAATKPDPNAAAKQELDALLSKAAEP